MSIFLAWIIVGLCSTMILHNIGHQVCGKYYLGVNLMASMEKDGTDSYNGDHLQLKTYHYVVLSLIYLLGTLAAPITLYSAIKSSFAKNPYGKIKVENDEFVKRHGLTF